MTETADPSQLDDHAFAVWAAEQAGAVLLEVRAAAGERGLEGKALKDAGDAAAQEVLARVLAEHRPEDSVLSEEAADDKGRLDARRVWIIDPLDGTREFSEPPRDDWAVHVALWEASADGGDLVAGAVAPARPRRDPFSTGTPPGVPARTAAGRGSRSAAPGRRRSWRPSRPRSTPSWCPWAPPGSR